MLKQNSNNCLFTIILLSLLSSAQAYTDRMDVLISNTPQFYYSHNCELTLSVISSSFLQYKSESFLIKIVESYENVHFLPYFVPPYIYTNSSELIKQTAVDNCNRGISTSNFTCVFAMTNTIFYPDITLRYNATHSMYKFVLNNIVCPIRDVQPSKYHLKIQVEVPVSVNSAVIRMAGNYTHRFVGLRYRVIQNVLANLLLSTKGEAVVQNQSQVQAKNYLVGYPSKLSITMEIVNQTELNNWKTLKILFTSSPKSLNINMSSCMLTTSQQLITGNLSNYYNITQSKNIPCSYVSTTNTLSFTNPKYVGSSFMYNQAFNPYGLYVLPASRLNFSVDITFNAVDSVGFKYQVVSDTAKLIDDYGKLINVSNQSAILYESSQQYQTIFGLNLTQYQKINPKYRVYCKYIPPNNTITNKNTTTNNNITPTNNNTSITNKTANITNNTNNTNITSNTSSNTNKTTNLTDNTTNITANTTKNTDSNLTNNITTNNTNTNDTNTTNPNNSNTNTSNINDNTFNKKTDTTTMAPPNLNSFIAILSIVVAAFLVVCIRKQPKKWQKYMFVIFIISDFVVKIVLIIVIDSLSAQTITSANQEISYMLSIFMVIQYLGFSIVVFLTYSTYILCYRHNLTKNSSSSQKGSSKSILFLILTLLFNYKLYCICLFNLKISSTLKTKSLKNKQLYIKHCWHLFLQVLFILLQVFCVVNSCTYLSINLVFAIHQGVYVMLIALVGKSLYCQVNAKNAQSKIKSVCKQGKIKNTNSVKEDEKKAEDDKKYEQLQLQQKKSIQQMMKSVALPTQRPFIPRCYQNQI